MPVLSAPHWNEETGVCTKHMLPMIPCLQCAAEEDRNVTVKFTADDILVHEEENIPFRQLLPAPFSYLARDVQEFEQGVGEFLGELSMAEDRGETPQGTTNAFRARHCLEPFD